MKNFVIITIIIFMIWGFSNPDYGDNTLPMTETFRNMTIRIQSIRQEIPSLVSQDKDFSAWLSDECSILERLINNIQYDYKHLELPEAAMLIALQKHDFNYLASAIKNEIAFYKKVQSKLDFSQKVNVRDFGAQGDGQQDDGPAIHRAIQEAVAKKIHVVFLPKGQYRIKIAKMWDIAYQEKNQAETLQKNRKYKTHIALIGLKNLVLQGEEGTELIMGEYDTGIGIINCNNVTVKNIAINYDPSPVAQGRIVKIIDTKTFDVKIDKGFPAPSRFPFKASASFTGITRFFSKDNIPGTNTPRLSEALPWQKNASITKINENIYRYVIAKKPPRSTSAFSIGDRVVSLARRFGNPAVLISNSNRCTADGVTIYASPTFAVMTQRSRFSTIKNCKTAKKDSNTLLATCADGVMVHGDRLGPFIKNCTFESLGDDFINIHSIGQAILKMPRQNELEIKKSPFFKIGDHVAIMETKKGQETIKAQANITDIITFVSKGKKRSLLKLDSPLKGKINTRNNVVEKSSKPDRLLNMTTFGHGFVIRDNQFKYGISRMLLGGRNGTLKNNVFKDNLNYHELLFLPRKTQGRQIWFAGNIDVSENEFHVRHPKHFIWIGNLFGKNDFTDAKDVRHLFIRNNKFFNYRNLKNYACIFMRDVNRTVIANNQFVPGSLFSNQTKTEPFTEIAIEIDRAMDVKVEKNQIQSSRKGQIKIGLNVKNTTVESKRSIGRH